MIESATHLRIIEEAQRRFQALRDRGLNQPGEMENRFGELLGTLLDA